MISAKLKGGDIVELWSPELRGPGLFALMIRLQGGWYGRVATRVDGEDHTAANAYTRGGVHHWLADGTECTLVRAQSSVSYPVRNTANQTEVDPLMSCLAGDE